MKRTLFYSLLLLAFLGAVAGPAIQFLEIRDQRVYIEAQSIVISSYADNLDTQQIVIDEMLVLLEEMRSENNSLLNVISIHQDTISELEEVANSRVCQSIDLAQFENNIYRGTTYVVTPSKMGWTSWWSIREDVIFDRDYGLARGYEFRIDLTPGIYNDYWQEIHTTIRAFSSSEQAKAFFDNSKPVRDAPALITSVNFGIPIKAWGAGPNDPAETMVIEFWCGNFQVDIKTKYVANSTVALPILERAATIVFGELSRWAP